MTFFIVEKFVRVVRGEDSSGHCHSHQPKAEKKKKSKQSDDEEETEEKRKGKQKGTNEKVAKFE